MHTVWLFAPHAPAYVADAYIHTAPCLPAILGRSRDAREPAPGTYFRCRRCLCLSSLRGCFDLSFALLPGMEAPTHKRGVAFLSRRWFFLPQKAILPAANICNPLATRWNGRLRQPWLGQTMWVINPKEALLHSTHLSPCGRLLGLPGDRRQGLKGVYTGTGGRRGGQPATWVSKGFAISYRNARR